MVAISITDLRGLVARQCGISTEVTSMMSRSSLMEMLEDFEAYSKSDGPDEIGVGHPFFPNAETEEDVEEEMQQFHSRGLDH